jgi:D-galactarolactone isomerase
MFVRPLTGRAPRLKAPAGSCDTHMHFYDKAYPALPGTLSPGDATVDDYRQIMRWLGLDRVVVVQANAYGDDNTLTMRSVEQLGQDVARAVVVVKPGVTDEELDRLTKGGARGIRFMALHGGTLGLDLLDELTPRIIPFGWHAIVQLDGRELPKYEEQLLRLRCPFVIDHTGKFLEPVGVDHPGFKTLLRLVDSGRCWVKLSGVYETSKTGAPHYEDVGRLSKELAHRAPERMLWASNWPHPQGEKLGYPDDANLLDLLLDWASDEAAIERILVSNPAELYGFAAPAAQG